MKRRDALKKFDHVKDKISGNPKAGDCFEMSANFSIKNQIKNCKEGNNKIFYMKVKKVDLGETGVVDIEAISDNIYISPTEYL